MLKKLISILIAIAVIAVVVMAILGAGSYRSMVQWPWECAATTTPIIEAPKSVDVAVEPLNDSLSQERKVTIQVEGPIEAEL